MVIEYLVNVHIPIISYVMRGYFKLVWIRNPNEILHYYYDLKYRLICIFFLSFTFYNFCVEIVLESFWHIDFSAYINGEWFNLFLFIFCKLVVRIQTWPYSDLIFFFFQDLRNGVVVLQVVRSIWLSLRLKFERWAFPWILLHLVGYYDCY